MLASATTVAAWLACAPDPAAALGNSQDAASAALIVLPGARDVHHRSQEGGRGVTYSLEAEFPAAAPILAVGKRLQRLGWFPLKEDPLNPWTRTARSWTSFVDASGPTRTRWYSWWSEWTNLGGDHVSYGFRYEAAEHGEARLRTVVVAAGFYPARLARQLKEEATLAAVRFEEMHPEAGFAPTDERRAPTVLAARTGDAFLLSGPEGEGAVRITGRSGDQVAYSWRFRAPAGTRSSGSVAEASTLSAGPLRLLWLPHFPSTSRTVADGEAAVGYVGGLDVIPIPGEQFESLDLGQAHALAILDSDRNRRPVEATSALAIEDEVRRYAIIEAGKTASLGSGRALLVSGRNGSGVIEIVAADADSVKYRWRFRESESSSDASGESEASERPFPELRVGPYALQWQMRSMSEVRDGAGASTSWSADVKYLPEELSLATIPAGDARRLDLAAVSATRPPR